MGEVTTSPIETLEVGPLVGLGSMAEMKKLHQKHFGKGKQTKERTYKTDNGRSYELGALYDKGKQHQVHCYQQDGS